MVLISQGGKRCTHLCFGKGNYNTVVFCFAPALALIFGVTEIVEGMTILAAVQWRSHLICSFASAVQLYLSLAAPLVWFFLLGFFTLFRTNSSSCSLSLSHSHTPKLFLSLSPNRVTVCFLFLPEQESA